MVHSFDFPVEEITGHSDYNEYTLYVNGEKTDIEINEGEQPIGEFPNDGIVSLSIGKDFPWGEVRSEEVKITNEDEIEFHIEHALNEKARTALMEQLNTIVANYQEALTKKDASILDEGMIKKIFLTQNLMRT